MNAYRHTEKKYRMFETPIGSLFDMFILSMNQIDDIYTYSLNSSYAVIGKVKASECFFYFSEFLLNLALKIFLDIFGYLFDSSFVGYG